MRFQLQANTTKSLNKKYYREHKILVLTVVLFVKGFGCIVLKLKMHNFWTYTRVFTNCTYTLLKFENDWVIHFEFDLETNTNDGSPKAPHKLYLPI